MNNGEIDKKIEFIIEQQAQFSADIQVMREVHEAHTKLLKEETKLLKEETKLVKEETKVLKEQNRNLSDAVMTVVGLVGRLAQAQERTDTKLTELAEAQARIKQAEFDRRAKRAEYLPDVSLNFNYLSPFSFSDFLPKNIVHIGIRSDRRSHRRHRPDAGSRR